jgi:hypothetical protein
MIQYLILGEAVFVFGLWFAPMGDDRTRVPLGVACAAAAVSVVLWPLLVLAAVKGICHAIRGQR